MSRRLTKRAGTEQAFVSATQSITLGGTFTVAHGLGVVPDVVLFKLICDTTDLNYSVGDEVPFFPNGAAGNCPISVVDATNITVQYPSNAFRIINKTTGGSGDITVANWSFQVVALALNPNLR